MSIEVVYIVGTDDDKFIADSIYTDINLAIDYCKERLNYGGRWIIMSAPIGTNWMDWEIVYPNKGVN